MRPLIEGAFATEIREFHARYGGFLLLWQSFELLIEVAITRELRLSEEEATIVCATLGYAAKINVLLALLKRDTSNASAIKALQTASQSAEQNDFTHSFMIHEPGQERSFLIRRTMREGNYKIDQRPASKDGMQQHGNDFAAAYAQAAKALGITEADVDAYA